VGARNCGVRGVAFSRGRGRGAGGRADCGGCAGGQIAAVAACTERSRAGFAVGGRADLAGHDGRASRRAGGLQRASGMHGAVAARWLDCGRAGSQIAAVAGLRAQSDV
jgi:hypothetical protein